MGGEDGCRDQLREFQVSPSYLEIGLSLNPVSVLAGGGGGDIRD